MEKIHPKLDFLGQLRKQNGNIRKCHIHNTFCRCKKGIPYMIYPSIALQTIPMQFTRYDSTGNGRVRRFPFGTAILVISVLGFFWNARNFHQNLMIARDLRSIPNVVNNDNYDGSKVDNILIFPETMERIYIHLNESETISPPVTLPQPPPMTTPKPQQSFLEIAKQARTDKVEGHLNFRKCVRRGRVCVYPEAENKKCRPWGHFYDTVYDKWLAPYLDEPMQFLEIGFIEGNGFEAYTNYFAANHKQTAELHSMEITCQQGSDRNHAQESPHYITLVNSNRLHCGDASDYDFLHDTWRHKMKRPDAPPLMVVVDDGSHLAQDMAASLFFWFPRIEPGGILVVEDIQPIPSANRFRTHILPQVQKDLHWCGGPNFKDSLCFPTIQPFLQGIHCEMHICVFQRNDRASVEPSRADSLTPANAFAGAQQCLFGPFEGKDEGKNSN